LTFAKIQLLEGHSWKETKSRIEEIFSLQNGTLLEYIELVNPDTFEPFPEFVPKSKCFVCIAAYVASVRLIDNLEIIP
jgi:pantothenate synthetase